MFSTSEFLTHRDTALGRETIIAVNFYFLFGLNIYQLPDILLSPIILSDFLKDSEHRVQRLYALSGIPYRKEMREYQRDIPPSTGQGFWRDLGYVAFQSLIFQIPELELTGTDFVPLESVENEAALKGEFAHRFQLRKKTLGNICLVTRRLPHRNLPPFAIVGVNDQNEKPIAVIRHRITHEFTSVGEKEYEKRIKLAR